MATAPVKAAAGMKAGKSGQQPVPMRDRIIAAAADLFYAQGLRAVSAEKIIAQVGITESHVLSPLPDQGRLDRRLSRASGAVGARRDRLPLARPRTTYRLRSGLSRKPLAPRAAAGGSVAAVHQRRSGVRRP